MIYSFEILVLEKEDEVGGLARSVTDEKGFTWDLGVHVLGVSNYCEFEEVINSAVNKWNKVKRSVKVRILLLMKSIGCVKFREFLILEVKCCFVF